MKLLLLFGGQGLTNTGLYGLLKSDKKGAQFLSDASKILNADLLQEVSKIAEPHFAQVLIGIYHLGIFHCLQEVIASHEINMAGYSLGEVSAFLSSAHAPLEASIKTLQYRTQLMTSIFSNQSESPYDLISISGRFTFEELDDICKKNHCEIAIINAQGHFIVGGKISDIQTMLSTSQNIHIDNAKFLSVHEPSHTSFYKAQSEPFTEFLKNQFEKSSLNYPIINSIQQKKIEEIHEEMTLLGQELSSQLHWQKVCELIPEYGYDLILDLGPGSAMSSILHSSGAKLMGQKIIAVADFNTVDGLKAYILKYL